VCNISILDEFEVLLIALGMDILMVELDRLENPSVSGSWVLELDERLVVGVMEGDGILV
jgi:hypothetical protein